MTIKLIAVAGECLRTKNVERADADTHIAAGDRWADEARCLLAWEADESGIDPTGWTGHELIFTPDIGDAEPVAVLSEMPSTGSEEGSVWYVDHAGYPRDREPISGPHTTEAEARRSAQAALTSGLQPRLRQA